MRTRSKFLETVITPMGGPFNHKGYNSAGTLVNESNYSNTGNLISSEGSEVITDDPSPGRGVKTVTHTKTTTQRFLNGSISSYSHPASGNRAVNTGLGALWFEWVISGSAAFPTEYLSAPAYTRSESSLVADTIHAFYSTNETDSLLNIIEAPQLVSTLRSMKSLLENKTMIANIRASIQKYKSLRNSAEILKRIKSLQDQINKAKSAVIKRSLRQSLRGLQRTLGRKGRNASSAYLAYSFGIAPLIADMQKVEAAMKDLRVRMAAAQRSAGKLVSVHRRDQGRLSILDLGQPNPNSSSLEPFSPDYGLKWTLVNPIVERTCTVRGYRTQKFSSPLFQELDYLMGRFGATGPTSLLWELSRYSFVLDWFVDLRAITDRLDNLLTGSTKSLVDICISEKSQYAVRGTLMVKAPYSADAEGSLMVQTNVSHYHRKPMEATPLLRPSGRFGKKQASLLAALLHQKMANFVK